MRATDYTRLKQFTKSQINGLTKKLNGFRWEPRTATLRESLCDALGLRFTCYDWIDQYGGANLNVYLFDEPRRITAEQTAFGKQWLKEYFYKKDGTPRSGKRTEDVEAVILANADKVSRFEFVGVVGIAQRSNTECSQYIPLYRAFTRKGVSFDYAPIFWGTPLLFTSLQAEQDKLFKANVETITHADVLALRVRKAVQS